MPITNLNKTPFPWFGGKSKAAPAVWAALGDVDHYVEPFAGGLAVLLNRPHPANRPYHSETVNDLDGLIVNAWRSIQHHPEETAHHASWPVTEADKTARQTRILQWRTNNTLDLLAADPDWCDPQIGGWWMWAVCVQIGAFTGDGPWIADPKTGRLIKQQAGTRQPGVKRDLPHLTGNGQGVNRPQLRQPGVKRNLPHITGSQGVNHAGTRQPGVSRGLPHISDNGKGVNRPQLRQPGVTALDNLAHDNYHDNTMPELLRWFRHLSARLRHVRILNGDWTRPCKKGAWATLPVRQGGIAGIFLDPPYDTSERSDGLYAAETDGDSIPAAVREWCLKNGDTPNLRVVLAGYDTEHAALESAGWTAVEWYETGHLTGGYGNGTDKGNQQNRERLWLSPHCNKPDTGLTLF